ncbi:MAG: hypothetical protein R3200_07070 [Xanthomonadales bacterium]|nr:hypothetical protein [Xanthomonadales bacterium]
MNETFHFDEPGTLVKPGPIGRLVRLLFGILCLSLVWQVLVHGEPVDLRLPGYWALAAFALLLVPYVVNIGFGVVFGTWPRWISAGVMLAAAGGSWIGTGELLGTPLWWLLNAWLTYVYGHLGISFVLSSVLGTPGCEMRAIPDLFGRVSGSEAREHYCPGFIDSVDRWEHGTLTGTAQEKADWVGNPARMLLLYGVPFLALQLAGNFGGPLIGNGIPALALLFVGGLCAVNAWRVRRVHCVLLAPVLLAAGIAMTAYTTGWSGFGPGTWSLIVNGALTYGFVVGCFSEHLLGHYLGGPKEDPARWNR